MNASQDLLSAEVLASLLVVGSLVMSIRSILFFTKTASNLRPKLEEVELELNRLRNGMADKKQRVAELQPVVAPLKSTTEKMTSYYEQLTDMRIEDEKRVHEAEGQQETERKKRIQRTMMGLRPS